MGMGVGMGSVEGVGDGVVTATGVDDRASDANTDPEDAEPERVILAQSFCSRGWEDDWKERDAMTALSESSLLGSLLGDGGVSATEFPETLTFMLMLMLMLMLNPMAKFKSSSLNPVVSS